MMTPLDEATLAAVEAVRKVRITGVRVHLLEAKLSRRFGWSLNWTDTRTAALVEVRTNAGISGWGDGHWGGTRLEEHPELVVGRSPFEVEAIFDDLRPAAGHQTRVGEAAAGGLDTALWDLCGKLHGVPVCNLLGRYQRSRVSAYLTALYRQDWPDLSEGLAEEAREWKRRGWRSMKMKTGYGAETDARVTRAVREAVGVEVELAVDSNCAYDAGTAIALGRRLEEFDLAWWEEPLLADDLEGYDRLARSIRIPLACGETLSTDRLIVDCIQPRRVDIIQPDLETVGLTGGRRLSYLAWLNHLRMIPHNWGTAVRTAATLHWLACAPALTGGMYAPKVMFEFDQTESPFRDAVVRQSLQPSLPDGTFAIPEGPGLGIDIVPEAVREFRTRLIEIG